MNIKTEIQKLVKEALTEQQQLSKSQQLRLALSELEDCISRMKLVTKAEPSQMSKKRIMEIVRELEHERDSIIILIREDDEEDQLNRNR
jgi:L-lactate utilization protein LutC